MSQCTSTMQMNSFRNSRQTTEETTFTRPEKRPPATAPLNDFLTTDENASRQLTVSCRWSHNAPHVLTLCAPSKRFFAETAVMQIHVFPNRCALAATRVSCCLLIQTRNNGELSLNGSLASLVTKTATTTKILRGTMIKSTSKTNRRWCARADYTFDLYFRFHCHTCRSAARYPNAASR